VTIYYLPKTKD
jgi:hypothetical protein